MKRIFLLLSLATPLVAQEPTDAVALFPLDAVRSDGLSETVRVGCDQSGYFVVGKKEVQWVQPCDVDPEIKTVFKDGTAVLNQRIRVKQYDNGEYKLVPADGLNGGGQVLGAIFYGLTKGAIYGALALGIGAVGKQITEADSDAGYQAAVATGTACVTELATGEVSGAGIIAGAAEATGTGQSLMEGASIVAVESTGGSTAATASAVGGANAFIESIALYAYYAGLAIPWL